MQRFARVSCMVFLTATFAYVAAVQPRAATAEQPCPAGTSPDPRFSVGDLILPTGAIPYSTIALTRYTLAPGEMLPTQLAEPIMYFVESGELQYPSQAGVGIVTRPACLPDDGHISMSGSITTTADDYVGVRAGQSLVAEHGLEGPLRNGGDTPLVLLEVRVIVPEIDPASGLPIVDPVTAAREQNRDLRQRKEECRAQKRAIAAGTPAANLPAIMATPEPTPAFTTSGWASDAKPERRTTPRACQP